MSDDEPIDIDKPGQRRVNVNGEDVKLHIYDDDEHGQVDRELEKRDRRLGKGYS